MPDYALIGGFYRGILVDRNIQLPFSARSAIVSLHSLIQGTKHENTHHHHQQHTLQQSSLFE